MINLLGLSLGLTTVILIAMWVKDELSINRYHANSDRIYAVMTNHDNAGGIVTWGVTPAEMAEAMKAELPQVELAAGVSPFIKGMILDSGTDKLDAEGLFVDQDYLDMFSHEFIIGNRSKALLGINAISLSESMAKNLFGSPENAMGKSLKWQVFDFSNEVEVTGVYRDFGSLDVEKPEFLMAFPFFKAMLGDGAHWDNFNSSTVVLLREGTDETAFNTQIASFIKDRAKGSNVTPFVQLYADTYLYGTYEGGKVAGGRINYVWIFSGIALFILLIACINFMNLTTARSMARAKEIGVKKSMGASRMGIFGQFMVKSLLLTLFALVIALITVSVLQPVFNKVTLKELSLSLGMEDVLILVGFWAITSLIAGIYPSLYLSKFKPVQIMKNNLKGSVGELLARKGLVVFQFMISMLLIIGVVVIGKQMNYIQNQNLGYNQSHLLKIPAESIPAAQMNTVLDQVKEVAGVENASSLTHPLIGLANSTIGLTWEGKNPDEQVKFENISVNMGLIETMDFELVEGRSFSPEFGEENTKIILNEAAVRTIGFENPIGQIVNLWGNDMEVIGVVKNFHFESLKESVKPAFIKYDPGFAQNIMVRINTADQQRTIAGITQVFQTVLGQKTEIAFMDESYQTLYLQEQRVSVLSEYFGVIAIFLSCLGLFGLAAFTAESRKKEIGVRKVLGASMTGILNLITLDFIKLVLISVVIALPLGWYFANSWLETYAFQTKLSWWIFAGSGLVLLVIAIMTVGYQAYKAASSNPVNSLRSE
ncbi:ABC transporter permease [Algoriphagus sp.]|uniref:ABC transporter permease n=1 Tax=Algoriphagus sp. TaxID=1872435 RepID=UPI0027213C04|nr:ABC transporter permease [Algoriphagus sp.]MDO8966734.1 ABC transporter permease [Algoriphagus sp.]MDP3199943.1 ABC transporter permease [Algoriphagus sp.]